MNIHTTHLEKSLRQYVALCLGVVASLFLFSSCEKYAEEPPLVQDATDTRLELPKSMPLSGADAALAESIREEYKKNAR